MALSERLTRAQEILGHEFNDKVLLRAALTHPSAVEGQPVSASYERLEFLGDSILGAVVARSLFESYPEFDEGKLTRLKVSLVSGATLSEVSHELGIDDIIIFGASETGTGARGLHSALENVYESLVGALYLDAGWDAAAEFIHRTLKPHLVPQFHTGLRDQVYMLHSDGIHYQYLPSSLPGIYHGTFKSSLTSVHIFYGNQLDFSSALSLNQSWNKCILYRGFYILGNGSFRQHGPVND